MLSFKESLRESVKEFRLPAYREIPNVGLYLEQTSKYITEIGNGEAFAITGSMISNYVKKGLITNPVKKQYSREQIAYLIFITMAKSVISMEDIRLLIEMQKETYDCEAAYTYLANEVENVMNYVFGITDEMKSIEENSHDAKMMLRNVIITVAYKAYLDKYFDYYRKKH